MKYYCNALPLGPVALNDIQKTKQGTLSSWQKSRVTWILQAGFHWDGEKGVENLTWPHLMSRFGTRHRTEMYIVSSAICLVPPKILSSPVRSQPSSSTLSVENQACPRKQQQKSPPCASPMPFCHIYP